MIGVVLSPSFKGRVPFTPRLPQPQKNSLPNNPRVRVRVTITARD